MIESYCARSPGSGDGAVAMMKAAEHGRPVDLGGWSRPLRKVGQEFDLMLGSAPRLSPGRTAGVRLGGTRPAVPS